jgi:hypothetical protein
LGRELGLEPAFVEAELLDFKEEFGRKNPFRRRLFRLLAKRVAARGRPVLALPISHGADGRTLIRLGEAAVLRGGEGGELDVTMWQGGRLTEAPEAPELFARRWIAANFD